MFDNVRRISGHLLVYGSADVAILPINFLLLPVYTRVLAPSEYGVLALVLVLEAVLKPLYQWGLDTSYLRLHYDCRDDAERRTLAGTIILFLLGANGMLTLCSWRSRRRSAARCSAFGNTRRRSHSCLRTALSPASSFLR